MICIFCNEQIVNNRHYTTKKCKIFSSNQLIKKLDKIEKEINNKNIFNIIFLYWYSYEINNIYLLIIDKTFEDFLYSRYINYLYYYNRWKKRLNLYNRYVLDEVEYDENIEKIEKIEEINTYVSNMETISKNCHVLYNTMKTELREKEIVNIVNLINNVISVNNSFYYDNYNENKFEFLLATDNFINITRRFVCGMLIINKKYTNSRWNHKFERDHDSYLDWKMNREIN
jgi:hypothetical protein